MFESTSRYAGVETATHTAADGREIVYVRRRFVPPRESLQKLAETRVQQSDRIDLVTARTLGDPEQFWRICDANDALDPYALVVPGRRLTVPMPMP
jgi:hypothetical protein